MPKTSHQPDAESPFIPGVDYDVLSPEQHAAEFRQPDPALEENDRHVLALIGELPTYSPTSYSEITPEEWQRIHRNIPDSFF